MSKWAGKKLWGKEDHGALAKDLEFLKRRVRDLNKEKQQLAQERDSAILDREHILLACNEMQERFHVILTKVVTEREARERMISHLKNTVVELRMECGELRSQADPKVSSNQKHKDDQEKIKALEARLEALQRENEAQRDEIERLKEVSEYQQLTSLRQPLASSSTTPSLKLQWTSAPSASSPCSDSDSASSSTEDSNSALNTLSPRRLTVDERNLKDFLSRFQQFLSVQQRQQEQQQPAATKTPSTNLASASATILASSSFLHKKNGERETDNNQNVDATKQEDRWLIAKVMEDDQNERGRVEVIGFWEGEEYPRARRRSLSDSEMTSKPTFLEQEEEELEAREQTECGDEEEIAERRHRDDDMPALRRSQERRDQREGQGGHPLPRKKLTSFVSDTKLPTVSSSKRTIGEGERESRFVRARSNSSVLRRKNFFGLSVGRQRRPTTVDWDEASAEQEDDDRDNTEGHKEEREGDSSEDRSKKGEEEEEDERAGEASSQFSTNEQNEADIGQKQHTPYGSLQRPRGSMVTSVTTTTTTTAAATLAAVGKRAKNLTVEGIMVTRSSNNSLYEEATTNNRKQVLGEPIPSLDDARSVATSPALTTTSTPSLGGGGAEEEPETVEEGLIFLPITPTRKYPLIKGGTLPKLVERLTWEEEVDTTGFVETFLMSYPSFTDPIQLLDELAKRYRVAAPSASFTQQTADPGAVEARRRIIRVRVGNIMKIWLEKRPDDFLCNSTLCARFSQTVEELVSLSLPTLASQVLKQLSSLLQNPKTKLVARKGQTPPPPLAPKGHTFLDFEPLEVARQMTLIEFEAFVKIRPSEHCLRKSWILPPDASPSSPPSSRSSLSTANISSASACFSPASSSSSDSSSSSEECTTSTDDASNMHQQQSIEQEEEHQQQEQKGECSNSPTLRREVRSSLSSPLPDFRFQRGHTVGAEISSNNLSGGSPSSSPSTFQKATLEDRERAKSLEAPRFNKKKEGLFDSPVRKKESSSTSLTSPTGGRRTKRMAVPTSPLQVMTRRFNATSQWVAFEVLSVTDHKRRALVVKHFIKVAQHLLALNNFNGIQEVLAGLQCAAVYRLKRTWRKLSRNHKEVMAAFTQLKELMSDFGSYKNYRQALVATSPPCIPYLGIHLSDILHIEDGNPDFIDKNNNTNAPPSPRLHSPLAHTSSNNNSNSNNNNLFRLINIDKRRRLLLVIKEIEKFQTTPYSLETETTIRDYLCEFQQERLPQSLDDDALWDMSLLCEPQASALHVPFSLSSPSLSSSYANAERKEREREREKEKEKEIEKEGENTSNDNNNETNNEKEGTTALLIGGGEKEREVEGTSSAASVAEQVLAAVTAAREAAETEGKKSNGSNSGRRSSLWRRNKKDNSG
ncbi:Son of sevenless 1 [Balamuthia mandrillaris]